MAASLDFLSSDIVFPSDSNEPKLSVNASSKLPDPVDWSLHDYYSTALEKTFVPIHSLTDLRKLDPVPEKDTFYEMPSFTVYNTKNYNNDDPKQQLSQDKMLLLLSIRKAVAAALPPQQQVSSTTNKQHAVLPPHPPALEDPKEIRAALRGALELTQNDMQHNGFAHPILRTSNNHEWKWEDEVLHDSLELPIVRTTQNNNHHNDLMNDMDDMDAPYLIDDCDDDDDYTDDGESLPYCNSQDDASSIAYSMSLAPPIPPIHQFDDATTHSTTTNTTLVSSSSSSRSSSLTATSTSRWSNVMNKLKSITKPFKASSSSSSSSSTTTTTTTTDKRSNNSNCNTTNQQQGGLRRFLLKRHH
ncbi:hypothetical protein BDA99DRAFT_513860 [Phascolomyces articulosus]|uniref:Uncharacterized protein n=1 Tax=Phascolomyces articulosus TaxID=60185 RepID=A0AAD5JY13_9FUNG|nr:hypothetical protein BDA99DRAFT_513860 [Phascolomyces articulosus]